MRLVDATRQLLRSAVARTQFDIVFRLSFVVHRYAAFKATASAAKAFAMKKNAEAAAALQAKLAKAAVAFAAKAAARKAAERAASTQALAQANAAIVRDDDAKLEKFRNTFSRVIGDVSQLVSRTNVADSVANSLRKAIRQSIASNVVSEVKYYRGNECSMAAIFPDDKEFARECARVKKA
jgi:hypothetical protein